MNHTEYIDYHRTLAEKHVDLQHGVDGRIGFISTNTDEFKQLLNQLKNPLIHLHSLSGRLMPKGSYDFRDRIFGGFTVLVNENQGRNDFARQEVAFTKAKVIGLDIIHRIHQDAINGVAPFKSFDMAAVRYDQTGFYHNDWTGYAFHYPLTDKCVTKYNPAKWL